MNILASQFNTKSLLGYVMPSVLMMVFMSTYTIVDGLFVANLVGEDALAAVTVVWPVFSVVLALGLMFATGGTAVMGRLMGEGKGQEARSFLTLLYIIGIGLGLLITTLIYLFPNTILDFLKAEGDLRPYGFDYLLSMGLLCTSFFLQVYVQSFFALAGKPMVGFLACFAGGLGNIAMDYLFISPQLLNLGIAGAGFATGLGNCIPAVFSLVYFSVQRKGTLYFQTPVFHRKMLGRSMFNGLSELVTQLSTAVTILLFNVILLDLVGNAGVASISMILYIQMIQTAIYFGYSIGVAPIISYQYGAGDQAGLRTVLTISFRFIAVASLVVIAGSLLLDDQAVSIFISPHSPTFEMAKAGLRLFSIAYLFMGINIFMSAVFTALSNGAVSALLSLSRTLVFLVGALLVLPHILGINGVWLAVPIAELLTCFVSLYCYKTYKKVYGY